MALTLADRVRETSATTGTGTITLAGAVSGYQAFSVIGNGNTTYYCIANQAAAEWEVGVGTYASSGTTLARTTVLASSNAGAAVNFSAGTKDVFVVYPASKSVNLDANGVAVIGATTALGGLTNPIVAQTGSVNNYIQSYIYNATNGTSSSADFVAYASNSTDAHGWADMGFTSPTYADAVYTVTGPNEAYLFGSALNSSYTGNLVYATDSTGSSNAHQWYVGGFTQAKGAWKMQLTSSGLSLAGTCSDTAGNLRSLPLNSQTSAYVVAASDNGKLISITTGGVTINNSIMSAGMVITIYNNSGSSQTITQGSGVTLQWAGQSTSQTGNRTLGLYGMASVVFLSASSAVITGSGLT